MTKSRNIAITGGSGHLGTSLIELLLSQGHFVNALYTQNLPNKINKNLIWIKGDKIEDELFAKKAVLFVVERSFVSGLTDEVTKWFEENGKK